MFTGIVEEIGTVASLEVYGEHAKLSLIADRVVSDVSLGDSISVAGCCLTVTELTGEGFTADLMAETLRATALGQLAPGSKVNLERAMLSATRLGGHLVQGHVDGVAEVIDRQEQPGTVFLTIRVPDHLTRYLVEKGSVTLSGVSLTIVDLPQADRLRVGLIPHTLSVTTLGEADRGTLLNVEVDVIAKYVERLVQAGVDSPYLPTSA